MLQMAVHFEKTRKSYVSLYEKYQNAEEESFGLERQVKQLEAKYGQCRNELAAANEDNNDLRAQLDEMEQTLALMKEIVFENSDNANKLKLNGEQKSKLVRACSVKNSFRGKTPLKKKRQARIEETLDESKFDLSDLSFDDTMNESILKSAQTGFKTPHKANTGRGRGKRSIDTLKMDDSNLPTANSTVCTDSATSMDSQSKKIKCEIDSGNEVVTTVKGPAVLTVSGVKRRSGGRVQRPGGATSRRRQSRHHRQSILLEVCEEKDEDSFYTPVSNPTGTVKARKILGANESDISLEKTSIKHRFVSKRCVTIETCRVCYKRIRFSKICLKCTTCRVIVHPECESKLNLSCNDENSNEKKTPGKQNIENFLLDKKASPKIPPQIYLTVHSVDERLTEEGIYRVSGSTKKVQGLVNFIIHSF